MKKPLTFLIAISIFFSLTAGLTSCSYIEDFLGDNIPRATTKPISKPAKGLSKDALLAKSTLSSQGQGLYEKICKAIEKQEKDFVFQEDVKIATVKKIVASVQADRPEYFWFESYLWYAFEGEETVEKIEFKYNCTKSERLQRQATIDAYERDFKKGVSKNSGDYDKLKSVHDYIINHTKYDLESQDNQNIVSVMVYGESVCAGYAKSMQYLLKRMGIRCAYVNGVAKGRGSHAWNIVEIEGAYYYVDATWDDPAFGGGERQGYVSYSYFCVTTKEINKTHTADANIFKIPVCTATAANYFVRENTYFTNLESASLSDLEADLQASKDAGAYSFASKYSSTALMDSALEKIIRFGMFAGRTVTYSKDVDNCILVIFL